MNYRYFKIALFKNKSGAWELHARFGQNFMFNSLYISEETTRTGIPIDQPGNKKLIKTPTKRCILRLHLNLLHFGVEEVILLLNIYLNQVLD